VGSALVGLFAGLFEALPVSVNLRVFLMVGILGGFTTFSAYSLGALTLVKAGHGRTALLYIVASNALGIGLAFGGYFTARFLLRALNLGPLVG
jgi:CrcB protein